MLAGLAACLPDITLVCTADRPEASAQTQRGEDRAAVHGGRHEHDPLRRDWGRPDRPPVQPADRSSRGVSRRATRRLKIQHGLTGLLQTTHSRPFRPSLFSAEGHSSRQSPDDRGACAAPLGQDLHPPVRRLSAALYREVPGRRTNARAGGFCETVKTRHQLPLLPWMKPT